MKDKIEIWGRLTISKIYSYRATYIKGNQKKDTSGEKQEGSNTTIENIEPIDSTLCIRRIRRNNQDLWMAVDCGACANVISKRV